MKVKFTKLAALLLAGVALLAAGCTDYEVDIQKVDKKVDELAAKTAADLESQVNALKAMIATVEQNIAKVEKDYKDADAALKTELEGKLNDLKKQMEDQVKDLQALIDKKVDQTAFDAYKAETAETLRLLNEAVEAIKANYATKAELEAAVAEVTEKLNDYVLTTTFEEFVKIAATKAELEAAKTQLEADIAASEAKLEGELAEAKAAVEAELQKLNTALTAVNSQIAALDERVTILEDAVAGLINDLNDLSDAVDDIKAELAFAEGDLQGYIDAGDEATLEAAIEYVDEYMEWLIDQLNSILDEIYDRLAMALQRIQSIQYVPDYDDLKITVNMAYISQEVEGEAELARAEGEEADGILVVDQPTKVTYQFLPSQYAETIAAGIKENIALDEPWTREEAKDYGNSSAVVAFFNVKPVNTRAEEADAEVEYGFEIIDVLSADNTTGEVTFLVLPKNIASAQFAANGLKPNYSLEFFDRNGYYMSAGSAEEGYADEMYLGGYRLPNDFDMNDWLVGVWDYESLKAFEARSAFAAQLRLYRFQDFDINWDAYYEDDYDNLFIDYENELASPYNTLYPNATEINILPDPYKPELDEDGNPKTDDEGNTVLVKAVPEYQYLPYSALRENPVGEKENQDPQGYRIILDQVVPGVEIDGTVYTVEDAAKKGYILPAIETVFDEFTYDAGTAAEVDEENFKETAQVYAEIEMNPEKSAALRKLAVGNVITGWYHFETPIGETPFCGQVEITKPQGEVKVNAEIVWTYSLDADMDHEIFYNDAEPAYARVELPVNVDEESAATLEETLGVTIEDFRQAEASNVKIVYTDEEGNEVDATEDITIENVAIDEDGNLTMDITGFDWDKVYTITADYELEAALVNVIGTLTTVDRNRELMVINMPEYAVVLNGENYDAETDTYTTTPEEGDFLADLFKLFVDRAIINQNDPKDFDDAEAFLGEQTGKEGHLEAYEPEEGENSEYVTIGDDYAVLTLTSPQLYEVWKAGEALTSFVTSYIGQEIEIIWPVTVDLPGYNFLHLNYYTFNTEKETANFITKRDFSDNDGSVIWWSQVYPSYFTTVKSENETEGEAQNRNSNRYALADYDVAYINLAELAFNVVDEKDNILDDEAIEEANLVVKFVYTDETLGEKELPEVDQIEDFVLYESLWVDNTVFYYRTNEKKFIPAKGTLGILSGETVFELPTRFDTPKAAVKYPEEVLDYSTYAMARWTPFKEPVANGYTIVLDENKVYRVPLFKGMELKDNRPNKVSYYVIKDGEWVVGNVTDFDPEAGTYTTGGNGYVDGILANEAYHINTTFDYSDLDLPVELRKLLSVKYSADGEEFVDEQDEEETLTPYIVFDYTSEVQFRGTVTIPVVVKLENPWQEALLFTYDITIKGVE